MLRRLIMLGLAMCPMLVVAGSFERVVYFVNDYDGSVIHEVSEAGSVLRSVYHAPYGGDYYRVDETPAEQTFGYAGSLVQANGLTNMGYRFYDPQVGRFLSPDPIPTSQGGIQHFGRYHYANNNPYRYTDPDGRSPAVCLIPGPMQACAAAAGAAAKGVLFVGSAALAAIGLLAASNEVSEGNGETASEEGNTNPYDGPVESPVTVVDESGNAIPVGEGEQIGASDNGDYQQVKDREGRPTGVRLDRGGHRGHADPKARAPHGHRPGVTDETGNPHLPIHTPKDPNP